MITKIDIDEDKIFTSVSMVTSYIGANAVSEQDINAYDRIFTTDENKEILQTAFHLAVAECVEMLYPYTKQEISDTEKETGSIQLRLPLGFSSSTLELIQVLVKEYIIYYIVTQWLMLVDPNRAQVYAEKYLYAKQKIQTALLSRTRPPRRRLKPF